MNESRDHRRDIALVGMACRLPGAPTAADLWRLVQGRACALGAVPPSRTTLVDVDGAGEGAGWGGFLDDIHAFDAAHFGISPAEAPHLDVQQRLVMETAWHALEDAGVPVRGLAGSRTGVFVGQASHDHAMLYERAAAPPNPFLNTGISHALAANRLSYHWDLRGPSMAVDTACSSSLVALHLAVRSLRSGECHLAIVGGVNALLSPWPQAGAAALTALSPTGQCRPFDAGADGYVRAEGVGVVVLQRLDDAADRRVRAVVRGSATNQDGRTNGVTAPNGRAQTEVVRAALADGATDPSDLSFVETHGTGTPLGDPIEARALAAAVGGRREPLPIGSVKGNVGHTEAAAGIVGLMRAVLALEHRVVPPQAGHAAPNPRIDLDQLGLAVPTHATPLAHESPVAGVSSFGFGGSNAHVVLGASPVGPGPHADTEAPQARARALLVVSGTSALSVRALLGDYADRLERADHQQAHDLVVAAATRRCHLTHRVAVVADTVGALASAVRRAADREVRRVPIGRRRLAYVFSGHGSQWVGMGRRLLAEDPAFRASVAACDEAFAPLLGASVMDLIRAHDETDLTDVAVVQPMIFTIQVALASALEAHGVRPDAVVGHSVGEVAAAVVAGALTVTDGCRVVHRRNQAVASVRGLGGMAVVELDRRGCEEVLAGTDGVAVAAVNGPRSCVVSGPDPALSRCIEAVRAQGADARRVRVDYPSHSPLVDASARALVADLDDLQARSATTDVYSTVTGELADHPPDSAYWGRNLREQVRFADAIGAMRRDGLTHFLELSPHPLLVAAVAECVDAEAVVLPALRRDPGQDVLDPVLGALYESGIDLDFDALQGGRRCWADLPLYPFDHSQAYALPMADRPVPGSRQREVAPVPSVLATGHVVDGTEVLPATSLVLLAMTLATGMAVGAVTGTVSDLQFRTPVEPRMRVRHDPRSGTLTEASAGVLLEHGPVRPDVPADTPGSHAPRLASSVDVDIDAHVRAARLRDVDVAASAAHLRDLTVDGAAAVATVATEHWRTGAAAAVAALDAALLAALITEGAGNPAAGMGVVACMGRAEIHRGLDSWDDGPLQVRVRQATPGRVTEVDLLAADGLRYARLKEIVVHRADDAAAADSPNGAAMSSPDSVRMSLVEVLAEVLPGFVDAPAMDTTPFVDLGMDSLLAAEVRRRLEHRLGVRMSLSMFWRHPTIPEMVAALGEQAAAAADEAEPHTSALTDLLSVLDDHAHEGGDR